MERGACVQVKPALYVYTGGQEDGVEVTLIRYMRFPRTAAEITGEAVDLAERLITDLGQTSASVVTDTRSIWLCREEKLEA